MLDFSPNSKDIDFKIIEVQENQKIIIFERLGAVNFRHFWLISDLNN